MNKNQIDRYTDLQFLLDLLYKKKIVLTDPNNWEDRNDSYYIEKYKERSKYKTVLAMCLTNKSETFHYWKIFTNNSSGVCVRFNKNVFISELVNLEPNLLIDDVKYRTIAKIRKERPKIEELPFLKRYAFKDEREFRLIYYNKSIEMDFKPINITLKCIDAIILNPWLPKAVAESIKRIIRNIEGCSRLKIVSSSLIDNESWKSLAKK